MPSHGVVLNLCYCSAIEAELHGVMGFERTWNSDFAILVGDDYGYLSGFVTYAQSHFQLICRSHHRLLELLWEVVVRHAYGEGNNWQTGLSTSRFYSRFSCSPLRGSRLPIYQINTDNRNGNMQDEWNYNGKGTRREESGGKKMGYWKSKVLPKIQKVLGKDPAKKAAALEAIKAIDETKEVIIKEFEERQGELQPKVIEIYEASTVEIKSFIKEPKESALKKQSAKIQKFLDELVKIEFPGSKAVSEATLKVGPALLPGPVIFIFEKVSLLIPKTEETKETKTEETVEVPPAATTETEAVVVEERAIEEVVIAEVEKTEPSGEAAPPPAPVEEAPKPVEEPPVVVEEPPKPVVEVPKPVEEPKP
ncbi:Plasma membrane-associated cation-binding protein 1-like protein [Drosera capensis]